MQMEHKTRFMSRWAQYFPGADLPIAFFYSDDGAGAEPAPMPAGHGCFLAQLGAVLRGRALCFDVDRIACPGGKRYTGFSRTTMAGFEYFLSCGIPGKLEGERYKKTPELVRAIAAQWPVFDAPGRYIVFKRWDALTDAEEPEAVIFYAPPDVLSGLYTLAGYDEPDLDAVIAPFGSGCASIVAFPFAERLRARPRAVLGTFDVSARPCVRKDVLSFAVPMAKFLRMIDCMDESFLITESWDKVRRRMAKA